MDEDLADLEAEDVMSEELEVGDLSYAAIRGTVPLPASKKVVSKVTSQRNLESSSYFSVTGMQTTSKKGKSLQNLSKFVPKKSISDFVGSRSFNRKNWEEEEVEEDLGESPFFARSDQGYSPFKIARHTKSMSDLEILQKAKSSEQDPNTPLDPSQLGSFRRALSNPMPRSSASTLREFRHMETRRLNYLLLSKPVLPPEGVDQDRGTTDSAHQSDHKPFKRLVANTVGKPLKGKPLGKERRRKKKVKDGVIVFKGHPSWSIVLAFQVGLKHTSELLNSEQLPPELTASEGQASVVFELKATTQNRGETASTTWTHHAPVLYKKIREKFGITDREFVESVAADAKIRELPTPGRSGALFYVTEDEEYFIKTINQQEERKLKQMLPHYYEHITKHRNTLITRFLANFSMRTSQGHHIRLVAMGSIFRSGLYIDRKYDLKGSVINRQATDDEKTKDFVTLKDLDLDTVFFPKDTLEDIMDALEQDTLFLEKERIMDYSLLVGFSEVLPGDKTYEDIYGENEQHAPWVLGYQMEKELRLYRVFLGVIDILQVFTKKKKLEYCSKSMRYCSANEISVNPPSRYRRRFMHYMRDKLRQLPDNMTAPTLEESVQMRAGSIPEIEAEESKPSP